MKKLTAIFMTAILMLTFITGCGKKGRELYNKVDLADYVEVSDYLGIEVDTTTEDFQRIYNNILASDIRNYQITDDAIEENVKFDTSADIAVELGDMVNIDYIGYNGEEAFAGGTAEGAHLIIGSSTFIDDFEDELIGAKVGETIDVTATFPENYSETSLAGVDAVFTVTVNAIAKNPEEIYKALDLDSIDDYTKYLNKRAVMQQLINIVREKTKITDYPAGDVKILCKAVEELMVSSSGDSTADFTDEEEKQIKDQIVLPLMDVNMAMYYILDKENLEIYASTLESQTVDQPVIAESYAVQDIVMEYLYEKAVIK